MFSTLYSSWHNFLEVIKKKVYEKLYYFYLPISGSLES